mmetsp:Transcript_10883/g.44068  ORF Transcript_10883/g.44068 Transcript_10883/m.44068 type:complete len:207 (+) Transcript_10883:36-656(+)|eukprot:CAMPEP_0185694094 /NCGR_PEP_ID=MMETSP1164-20130828/3675_1 /TAXON_ID=1104430 /ORGANISM="Chrysoreinhardia sp, Strain CCMP2950" /LENGTH=206 /DNA_ID=CAMNT_0028360921 /DNA_START=34 /DNA_END=654 /DNA_ORIENTATION=-
MQPSNDHSQWQEIVASGVFDKDALLEHHRSDSRFLNNSQSHGAKAWMENEMRRLRMKTSGLTNEERYKRLCRHYVDELRSQADPQHYHKYPFRMFWANIKFWRHFFLSYFRVFENSVVQFVIAMLLMGWLHEKSYKWYTKKLPALGIHKPCMKLQTQFNAPIWCGLFKTMQDYTFSGFADMKKTLVALAMKCFIGSVAWMASRKVV